MHAAKVTLKVVLLVAATFVAALLAIGCVLSALFELQGFGRDGDPRAWYVALMAGGLVACVLVALGLWWLALVALPRRQERR